MLRRHCRTPVRKTIKARRCNPLKRHSRFITTEQQTELTTLQTFVANSKFINQRNEKYIAKYHETYKEIKPEHWVVNKSVTVQQETCEKLVRALSKEMLPTSCRRLVVSTSTNE